MTDSLQQEISTLRSLFWSPRDPEGHAFAPLADAYRRAGDFRHAVEVLRDGMDRHPDFVPGHVVAAQLYLEKGLLEEAEIASRRAVALDAENEVALELLADALAEKGEGSVEPADLAPEPEPEPEAAFEPVMDFADLAPDPEPETETEAAFEPVMDFADLAPDPEPEPETETEAAFEPVMDFADVAPVPEPEAEAALEPVMDIADLAPDPEPEPAFEPVMDIADLAPDPEPAFEPVMDFADLAPDMAPEPEPEPEPAALAPDEPVFDMGMLAPSERPPLDDELPADDFADETPLVTRTMGELYLRQGLTERALEVFQQLLEVSPGDRGLRDRVEELSGVPAPVEHPGEPQPVEAAADDEDDAADHHWTSGGLAARHEVDTPFAWTQEEEPAYQPAPETPPVGDYFRRMLDWAPGSTPDGVDADPRDDA